MQNKNSNLSLVLRQRETFGKIPEETKRFLINLCETVRLHERFTWRDKFNDFYGKQLCFKDLIESVNRTYRRNAFPDYLLKRQVIIRQFLDTYGSNIEWIKAFFTEYLFVMHCTAENSKITQRFDDKEKDSYLLEFEEMSSFLKRVVSERKLSVNFLFRDSPGYNNDHRSTPLHVHCRLAHKSGVELLLGLGADVKIQDTDHMTSADALRRKIRIERQIGIESELDAMYEEILKLLQETKRKQNAGLFAAGKRRKTNE